VRWLRYLLGVAVGLTGLATMAYGGLVGSVVVIDDATSWHYPFQDYGFLICVVGLFLIGLGARLFGAQIDWRSWD